MAISRRGFLQTLATALVGAATFDPKSLLWVPASATGHVELATDASVSLTLELNELALLAARRMTERLARDKSLALREIMFRHTGSVHLPPGVLELTDHGLGRFEPQATRLMVGAEFPSRSAFINSVTAELTNRISAERLDCFAPIGRELRVGEPFSDDVGIGMATDPESGLSVRVLRWEIDRTRGRTKTVTSVEMAGGQWKSIKEIRQDEQDDADEAAAIARERAAWGADPDDDHYEEA